MKEPASKWIPVVVRAVSAHEGQPGSTNANLDGAGLSYGVLQWTQRSGSLGHLLSLMHAAEPERFAACFGPNASALIDVALAGELDPVDGKQLWQEPWLSRFHQAAQDPRLVAVQYRLAADGQHMAGAVSAARALDVLTVRGLAVCFDRCVQQGAVGAGSIARRLAEWHSGEKGRRPAHPNDVLAQFAWSCAAKFRSHNHPPKRAAFRQVVEEYSELRVGTDYRSRRVAVTQPTWHQFAGNWSLYDLITRRSSALLSSTTLTDNAVDVSGWPS